MRARRSVADALVNNLAWQGRRETAWTSGGKNGSGTAACGMAKPFDRTLRSLTFSRSIEQSIPKNPGWHEQNLPRPKGVRIMLLKESSQAGPKKE